jgi:hypothetical protein
MATFLLEVDTMLKIRFIVICIFVSLTLCGCSSENSSSDNNKNNETKKIENPINSSSGQSVGVPRASTSNSDNSEQEATALPTRSELRVISEQAKTTENEAKDIIESFDANLDNRDARKDAETKFKKILPEYKKQMLQIGKAKLKEKT